MRVGIITEWLDDWRGGAETSTRQFIDHLIDLGADVAVFTRSHVASRPGMQVRTIRVSHPSRALQTGAFCRRADHAAGETDLDVVHAVSPSLRADLYQPRGGTYAESLQRNLAVRRSRSGRSFKRVTQRLNLKQRMLLSIERRMLLGDEGPAVIAISDYVARQLHEHYGLSNGRIHKVFNGVNPDTCDATSRARNREKVRSLYRIADDDLLVLMVAHNFKLKGLLTWMEALRLLSQDAGLKIRSLVVGKDRATAWRRLARRLGVDSVIQFPGPSQRIGAFFHAADVLVHPTYYDPCSRVILEALAAGVASVTTSFDGASEIIEDGVSGFVLNAPDDAAALAEQIRTLAEPQVRARMGAAGREAVAGFTMRRHAEQVFDLYRWICDTREKRSPQPGMS